MRTAPGGATVTKRPSSIERIQRLERLERERLAEKERQEERWHSIIAGVKPSGGRHDLVDRVERTTKYPMALLGIAWLVMAIAVVTAKVNGSASVWLVGSLFVLWAVLLAEYLVRLVVTPDRRGYLKRRWVEPATVAVPPLQGWHLVGIEKMGLLLREAQLRVAAILRHHSLFRVLTAAAATLFLGAWLLLFEENAKEHTDANKEELRKGHADLGQQLSEISQRLADVERRLGATPADLAAVDAAASGESGTNSSQGPDQGASVS